MERAASHHGRDEMLCESVDTIAEFGALLDRHLQSQPPDYPAGESAYTLAREFGASTHTIRTRIPDADWRGRMPGETIVPPSRPA